MAGEVIQFVDSVSASATVRLDVNSSPWSVLFEGTAVPPPPIRRAVATTLLADGSFIPASAYDNRVITLHLEVDSTSATTAATEVQKLHRELDRETNILRWQPQPAIPAVYFRTFRSPDYVPNVDHGINLHRFLVDIVAEPFALGVVESITGTTVNNNPVAGSNQKFMDITGVKGDVETPLIISLSGSEVDSLQSLFAVRRGGTPSALPYIQQAEACTMGTDTATVANNAVYSGSSNNHTSTSFSTVTTLAQRLSFLWPPGTAATDMRGTFRVFGRFSSGTIGVTSQAYTLQLRYGQKAISNSSVVLTNAFVTRSMVDLGLIQIPVGMDPESDGPSGSLLKISPSQIPVRLYASRQSGSGTLICDYFMFVPADDSFSIVTWGSSLSPSFVAYIFDGSKRMVYGVDALNQMMDIGAANYVGDVPHITPNVTNRLFFIKDVTLRTGSAAATADDPSGSAVLTCRYYPRYLTVRPVST